MQKRRPTLKKSGGCWLTISVKSAGLALVAALTLLLTACPKNSEDALMLEIYRKWDAEIQKAVAGTDVSPAYLAALITLESSPPGNRNSIRFEKHVYKRLLELKHDNRAYGGLSRTAVSAYSDQTLKQLATSYGLIQIMGYHCLKLGCRVEELKGDYQLQWAAAYMQFHYGTRAKQKAWEECFRIHNTGRPDGRTGRRDYVERGLTRMRYYEEWIAKKGEIY